MTVVDDHIAFPAGAEGHPQDEGPSRTLRRLVAVTGMHRSGTSLVSRILNLIGVSLGPEERLMPAHKDNPRGYWENLDAVAINDEVLAMFGGTWDRPPRLPAGWEFLADLDPLRARAGAVVSGIGSASAHVTGWKDPRTSLLMPFWQTVAPVWANIVVVRHPFQVAGSLLTRDGMEPESAATLWTRYVVRAWLAHRNRVLINYDLAVANPVLVAEHLADFLELDAPSSEIGAELEEFADPALQHHTEATFDAGPEMALALAVYAVIESQPFRMVDAVLAAIAEQWV
jgi:hypothetical protein